MEDEEKIREDRGNQQALFRLGTTLQSFDSHEGSHERFFCHVAAFGSDESLSLLLIPVEQ